MTQQKGRRVPLQLQTAVEAEIAKLIKESHIRRNDKMNDEILKQPAVITFKREKNSRSRSRCQTTKQCHPERQLPNAEPRQLDGTSSRDNK